MKSVSVIFLSLVKESVHAASGQHIAEKHENTRLKLIHIRSDPFKGRLSRKGDDNILQRLNFSFLSTHEVGFD